MPADPRDYGCLHDITPCDSSECYSVQIQKAVEAISMSRPLQDRNVEVCEATEFPEIERLVTAGLDNVARKILA